MGLLHWGTWPLPAPRVSVPGKSHVGKKEAPGSLIPLPGTRVPLVSGGRMAGQGWGLLPSIALTSSPWLPPAQLRTYFRDVGTMVGWTQAFTVLTVAARGGLEMR